MTQETQDHETDVTDEVEEGPRNWPRIAELTIEASLHRRRIHKPDIEQAAELANQAFRTALEAKGYRLDTDTWVTYGYRAMRKPIGGTT